MLPEDSNDAPPGLPVCAPYRGELLSNINKTRALWDVLGNEYNLQGSMNVHLMALLDEEFGHIVDLAELQMLTPVRREVGELPF